MNYKVISDRFSNAYDVLCEVISFLDVTKNMLENTRPFTEIEGISLPKYVSNTAVALHKVLIPDFESAYYYIGRLIVNGVGGDLTLGRLQDALYKFGGVQKIINENKCMLTDDSIREELSEKLKDCVGDIIVFIISQFMIHEYKNGKVSKAVEQYCFKEGMTVDVFYGCLLSDLETVERSWYAYEEISPYYQEFQDFDPVFAAEAADNLYPVYDATAKKLIDGELDVIFIRSAMLSQMDETEQKEIDVTPGTLLASMKLE